MNSNSFTKKKKKRKKKEEVFWSWKQNLVRGFSIPFVLKFIRDCYSHRFEVSKHWRAVCRPWRKNSCVEEDLEESNTEDRREQARSNAWQNGDRRTRMKTKAGRKHAASVCLRWYG